MMRPRQLAPWLVLLVCGCDPLDSNVPEDGPPPVSGGTLHVTADGRWAVASDPARAAIHVVDLDSREERHRIDLGPTDEPGRIIEDESGRVHVVLRRAGEVLTLEPEDGEVLERREVCAAPRGIDVDGARGELVVACAEGVLARLPLTGGAARTTVLEPDLRDVIVQDDGRLLVSVFRTAEVLVVEDGAVTSRIRLPSAETGTAERPRTLVPSVAWRMRPHPAGAILVHQHSLSTQLDTGGGRSGGAYGGDCQSGVVRSAVSVVYAASGEVESTALSGPNLAVDVAAIASRVYTASAAEPGVARDSPAFGTSTGVRAFDPRALASEPSCTFVETLAPHAGSFGAAVALAVAPGGEVIAQYREPARLAFVESGETIALSGGSAANMGYSLFHEAVGTGASCASCHPEGGDDGRVWQFDVGPRRTQTLRGGILATRPFHWKGDVPDASAVMDGTFVGLMGGAMPLPYEVEAFAQWVDRLPAPPGVVRDEAAVARGRAVFERADCGSCHAGELGTNNANADVGTGGSFQVPALSGLAYRAPYLHDGRAATLGDAVRMHVDGLTEAEHADVAVYLRSL